MRESRDEYVQYAEVFARGVETGGKKKSVSFGKRVLEIGFIKKILLAVYNKIFELYYE